MITIIIIILLYVCVCLELVSQNIHFLELF